MPTLQQRRDHVGYRAGRRRRRLGSVQRQQDGCRHQRHAPADRGVSLDQPQPAGLHRASIRASSQTDKSRSEIWAGGQNPRYNAITVDGISASDAFGLEGNSLPTPRQPVSMEAIDEIDINLANYDVTIAGGVGGVINAVTKSGTNEFHGSFYGIYRDNDWSGKNQNDQRPVLFDNENTYGATFGGPIVKDKLFFFVNYEKYKGKGLFVGNGAGYGPAGSGATVEVPITQAEIDEVIDISRNPTSPNFGAFEPGTLALPALNTEAEEVGIKIDWNINEAHRANFRYGKSEQSQANLTGFGNPGTNNQLGLSTSHYVRDFELETFSSQLFSDWSDIFSTEAKVSYRDYSAVRTPQADLPAIAIRIGNSTLNLGTEENTHANVLETETWNAFFAGNLFLGDHTVKFGFDYEDNDVYNLFGRRINGVYTFNSIEDYRNAQSSRYQLFYPEGGDLNNMAATFGLKNLGLFVQDSWAVNNNLTITAGIRYDRSMVDGSPTFNAAASERFGFDNSQTIDGKSVVSPRFGFNYAFDNERPTQLRGGIGLFQGASATVWLANPFANNGLSYTDFVFNNGIIGFDPDRGDQPRGTSGATQSVDFIDPDLQQPSVWKANLAFDTELPWWGVVAGAEVVMTSVKDGIFYQQLNLGDATAVGQDGRALYYNAAGLDPRCFLSSGSTVANAGGVVTGCSRVSGTGFSSNVSARDNRDRAYNDAIIARSTNKGQGQQLTFSLQKPFGESDWYWQAAYTYTNAKEVSPLTSSTSSSQLGNSMIFQANEEVSARSNYEIRDRFTAAASWKHAFFGDNETSVSLFYEGRSGKPFSYTFDNDANGDGRLNDLLYIPTGPGDVVFGSPAEEAAFWEYMNNNEYLNSHRGQVATRNASNAPWVNQFDLSVSQEFPGFMDGHHVKLQLDILNIGNLINKDWGRIEEIGFPSARGVVEYGGINADGKYVYRFNSPDTINIYDDRGISRWAAQVSLRYTF